MKPARFLSCFVFAAIVAASPQAGAAFPTVALKPVCLQQIHSPTTITNANDGSGRLFVCDQPGKIYIIQGGMLLPTPFLNIANPSNSASNGVPNNGPGPVIRVTTGYDERGLLGLAFHPGYTNPLSPGYRKFYVLYNKSYVAGTDPAPPQAGDPVSSVTVIAEYQVSLGNPNAADPTSERRLLSWTRPQSNHNGGQLEFGPDGYLYIGSGDGGDQQDNNAGHAGGNAPPKPTNNLGNGQDRTRFLGKILRIDPIDPDGAGPLTYGIPTSNPFFNDPDPNVKKEIYSFGMRNPWRFSFDKRPGGTNRLFCGDVGGDRVEEVDIIVSGGNYGWRYKEGHEFPLFSSAAPTNPMPNPGGTMIDPIAEYAHSGVTTTVPVLPQLGVSVTGGFVYRGSAIPAMQGKYVFGDYGVIAATSQGRLMGLEETAPGSGVFTLTQALPLFGSANPMPNLHVLIFGEDEAGEIYVGTKTNTGVLLLNPATTGLPAGGIYKIVPIQTTPVTMVPSKDNTIFSEADPGVGDITGYPSDALGYLYAGQTGFRNGPYLRRALMTFNIAAQIPAGAVVQSAQLGLQLTKMAPGSTGATVTLHRLTETWGEGTSMNNAGAGYGAQATTGDATWVRRFFDTQSWTTPGGTFIAALSSSAVVSYPNTTLPSTAQMVSDVQGWVDTPGSNAGWILRGDEVNTETVCQIASLQQGLTPPSLAVTYQVGPAPTHFESWLTTYFPANRVGQYVDPAADFAGDGIPNLVKYANGASPYSPSGSGIQASSVPFGGNTVFTFTFLRDPLATDLTYELQTSGDLAAWTTIAKSVGGAVAVAFGSAIVSESGSPIITVTAQETVPSPANRFVRLRVTRAP